MGFRVSGKEKIFSGGECARKVRALFGTNDVREIAMRARVEIVEESWQPVTFGEYHRKTKRIVVNTNAPEARGKIIAHELGHFFWQAFGAGNNTCKTGEESFCNEFAAEIFRD